MFSEQVSTETMCGHDVKHFRCLLQDKKEQLTQLCHKWQQFAESSENLAEEVEGEIRLTVGKAQLLTSQRFCQFSGLIDNCEFELGEKETTCDDLQGFWDMIFIQIEDVERKFDHLDQLQNNNWQINSNDMIQSTKKPKKKLLDNPATKPKVDSSSIRNHILAARKNLAKAKIRAMDGVSNNEDRNIKVFEAPGFFVISSPVRRPKAPAIQSDLPSTMNMPPSYKTASHTKMPLSKNYLPLAVVTRSAKKALLAKQVKENCT